MVADAEMGEGMEGHTFGKREQLRTNQYWKFPKIHVFAFTAETWRHFFIVIKTIKAFAFSFPFKKKNK